MAITVVAVGKKHEDWVQSGIERYQKRLRRPFNIEWVLLPHSSRQGLQARQEESERIITRLSSRDFVLLLDEVGKNISSPQLATTLQTAQANGQSIVIIIGGAYGVSDQLHQRANLVWSLSRLVFPHQLVRLILTEQLYRAQNITEGGSYHHT